MSKFKQFEKVKYNSIQMYVIRPWGQGNCGHCDLNNSQAETKERIKELTNKCWNECFKDIEPTQYVLNKCMDFHGTFRSAESLKKVSPITNIEVKV